jgi:DUF2934 family protein
MMSSSGASEREIDAEPAACFFGSLFMSEPSEVEITLRAYELWEKAGKPSGRDLEFYYLAEQELRNEDKANPLRTPDNL